MHDYPSCLRCLPLPLLAHEQPYRLGLWGSNLLGHGIDCVSVNVPSHKKLLQFILVQRNWVYARNFNETKDLLQVGSWRKIIYLKMPSKRKSFRLAKKIDIGEEDWKNVLWTDKYKFEVFGSHQAFG